ARAAGTPTRRPPPRVLMAFRRPCPAPRWPAPALTGATTPPPRSPGAGTTSPPDTAAPAAPGDTLSRWAGTEPPRPEAWGAGALRSWAVHRGALHGGDLHGEAVHRGGRHPEVVRPVR